jgi:pimeloyl-ACP methyl ester carboxylesterase
MVHLGLGRMPPFWDAVRTCSVPLHLIAGELDAKFGAVADRIAACAPRATVLRVANSGHNVVLEAPDAIALRIRAALDESA